MPGEPTFHMPYAMWLEGSLDAEALQRALDAMVARHSVLRTSIVAVDGVPEQVVADTGTVPIERIVAAGAVGRPRPTRAGLAARLATERAVQPFDLARGPLLRAALIDAGAGPLAAEPGDAPHHQRRPVAADPDRGAVGGCTGPRLTGVPASLPRLWMEYGDYAVWQQDRLRGEELERQLQYWRDAAARGADAAVAADRPSPAGPAVLAGRRGRALAGRRRPPPGWPSSRPAATPPCSWCSWPGSRRCCRATPARPTC